jgi:hypothetical protein
MKKIIVLFVSLILLLPIFRQASAQTGGEGLTISPPILDVKLDPGQSYQEVIKINNPTKDLVTVYPVARNFTASGETGVPAIESPGQDATYGLATWISFDQTKLALTPQQEIEFDYKINVPSDAEPGGHYASVLFASQPPKPDQNSTQVALASMVGSLILGTVSGNIVEKAEVAEFSANGSIFLKPPVNFTLRISNNGNVHFAPQGQISIKNWGKTVATQDINPQKGNILPNSIRRYDGLKYNGKWYSFGKFNVSLAATYGSKNAPLTGSFSFWIIPWWLITIIVLAIAAIIFFIIKRKKKSKNSSRHILPPEPPKKKKVILQ